MNKKLELSRNEYKVLCILGIGISAIAFMYGIFVLELQAGIIEYNAYDGIIMTTVGFFALHYFMHFRMQLKNRKWYEDIKRN